MTTLALPNRTPNRTKEAAVATITVNTLLKGAIEVPENQLITFASPLLGFEKLKRFLVGITGAIAGYGILILLMMVRPTTACLDAA